MKIFYMNDGHGRGKNSAHRIGNYYSDWLAKFDEALELSKKCDIIINGGDLFDTHTVSNTIVDDIIDRIEANNKPFYCIYGNHDQIGANSENSKSTSLAHMLRRSKIIKRLDELEEKGVYIKGYDYSYEIENDIKINGLKHNKKGMYTIVVPHAFISIKPFHPSVLHVVAKDIDTNYDLVLCSHFHHDTGLQEINKTKFLNIGAFGRLSITEANHEPKVAIIDTETKEINIIKLKSAKKGEEIFDLSKVEEVKAFNKNMENFIKSLESTNFQALNIRGMISEIVKKEKFDKNIVDLIYNKMGEFDAN